ncbi:MAG: hypothetical protein ACYC4R_11290 [Anaerolineae bacterium]
MFSSSGKRNRSEGFEEDALREVLAVEARAEGIVRDAQAEGQRIVASAKQKAQEIRSAAEAQAQADAEAGLRNALAEIEQQTKEIDEQSQREAERWLQTAESHFDHALSYLLDVITLGGMGSDGHRA